MRWRKITLTYHERYIEHLPWGYHSIFPLSKRSHPYNGVHLGRLEEKWLINVVVELAEPIQDRFLLLTLCVADWHPSMRRTRSSKTNRSLMWTRKISMSRSIRGWGWISYQWTMRWRWFSSFIDQWTWWWMGIFSSDRCFFKHDSDGNVKENLNFCTSIRLILVLQAIYYSMVVKFGKICTNRTNKKWYFTFSIQWLKREERNPRIHVDPM